MPRKERREPADLIYLLTPAQKYKIGKRAAEHGFTASIRYFAMKYRDLDLKESSVRRFKNAYQEQTKLNRQCLTAAEIEKLESIGTLPNKKALSQGL